MFLLEISVISQKHFATCLLVKSKSIQLLWVGKPCYNRPLSEIDRGPVCAMEFQTLGKNTCSLNIPHTKVAAIMAFANVLSSVCGELFMCIDLFLTGLWIHWH